jgi:hypothetical protein
MAIGSTNAGAQNLETALADWLDPLSFRGHWQHLPQTASQACRRFSSGESLRSHLNMGLSSSTASMVHAMLTLQHAHRLLERDPAAS